MTRDDQLLSFTGTMTYEGFPVLLNNTRLTKLIFDKNITEDQREKYRKILDQSGTKLTTAEGEEPELLYFERVGDRYYVHARGPGRYNGHTLSMEGPKRTWSAYSGDNSTFFNIESTHSARKNLTLENLISDKLSVVFRANGTRLVYNSTTPGILAAFTDRQDDYYELAYFELTIIERDVAN